MNFLRKNLIGSKRYNSFSRYIVNIIHFIDLIYILIVRFNSKKTSASFVKYDLRYSLPSYEHNDFHEQITLPMATTTITNNHVLKKLTIKYGHNPIQIGCCGADGSNDYITMRQPLPFTCRDTVTGNAFFHGCVDELTWLLEDKSGWIAGLAMTLSFIQVWTFSIFFTVFFFVTKHILRIQFQIAKTVIYF